MAFRDDEAARRERIETLEKELASAEKEHQRATASEREQEARRDELGKRVGELQAQLREAKRQPEPEPAPEPPTPARPVRASGPGIIVRTWKAIATGFWPLVIGGGTLAMIYFTIQDCRPACKPVDRYVELDLAGDVSEASGINMPIGTSCRVHTLFFADRSDNLRLWESQVTIACKGREVFDADESNYCGVVQTQSGSRWAYTVPSCSWSDDDLSIQWAGDSITLRSAAPAWSYTIRLTSPMESMDSLYDPVVIESILAGPTQVTAEVSLSSGASPVSAGASCVIEAQPTSTPNAEQNCNISVRCGDRVLRSALGQCGVRRGRAISAAGPGVTVDFAAGNARVDENEGPGVPYSASFRFAPP